ncbi:MAG: restriction endonuclease [Clostridia bacterium]
MTKNKLFLELANPDENGVSRWVSIDEFTGKYGSLVFGNGADWARRDGSLAKKYIIEFDKSITIGNRIDRVRLNGLNTNGSFNQQIRRDIRLHYRNKNCVMLGVNGKSANVQIEIDHKEGRKMSESVSNLKTQKIQDFQPLCKAANDIKRQICKRCKATNRRWNAKNIKGNPYSFYKGDEIWDEELGCNGCYQYDPVAYRKESVKKIASEVTIDIMKKLYGDDDQ